MESAGQHRDDHNVLATVDDLAQVVLALKIGPQPVLRRAAFIDLRDIRGSLGRPDERTDER
jgi:hypothetical protein